MAKTDKTAPATPTAPQIISIGHTQVRTITTRQLADLAPHLPPLQAVRGSVWPLSVTLALIDDIKAGLYVPPIVIAGNKDDKNTSDGQQRYKAILRGLKPTLDDDGNIIAPATLTGDEVVLLALDAGRTFEQSFERLNIGVPVTKALVTATKYPAVVRDAVVDIATHPYFDLLAFGTLQTARTARMDYATSAFAICAGWAKPESSIGATTAWLMSQTTPSTITDKDNKQTTNPPRMTADDVVKYKAQTVAVLDALAAEMAPIADGAKVKGKGGKAQRTMLANARKKNTFVPMVSAVDGGDNAAEVIRLACDVGEAMPSVDVTQMVYDAKRKRNVPETTVMRWIVGAGSSGSADDTREKIAVLRNAVATAVPTPPTATDMEAKDNNDSSVADLLTGLNLTAGG